MKIKMRRQRQRENRKRSQDKVEQNLIDILYRY